MDLIKFQVNTYNHENYLEISLLGYFLLGALCFRCRDLAADEFSFDSLFILAYKNKMLGLMKMNKN